MGKNIFNNQNLTEDKFKEQVDTHSKALINVAQRQKDLESSIDSFEEKIEFLDQNAISNFKKLFEQIKDLKTDIKDLKLSIKKNEEFNVKIKKQLSLMTTKDEVLKLEKYIDLWDPMDFATKTDILEFREKIKKDLKKIIEEFM